MIEKWRELIFSFLKSDLPFQDYRTILLEMKKEGMSDQDALQIFEEIENKLRSEENEKDLDRILEVMDIIVGYCSPHLRVW